MSKTLDPLDFPLWGTRLIEASAGTGKTWTIAALYLRLVLGHGGQDQVLRPMVPSEILVMTFTVAATRELSNRIRSRLLEAARCFRGEASPQAGDDLLTGLMEAYPAGQARASAAWRLSLAAEGMDDAAVHTIDAWCQRMLREHAFDSGCLFDEELSPNETAMQIDAARDYWRQQIYPLEGDHLDIALRVWKDLGQLTADARQLMKQELPPANGEGLGEFIERLEAEHDADVNALKAGWSDRAQEMRAWLETQLSQKPCPFSRTKLRADYLKSWFDALAAWATQPCQEKPKLGAGSTRLTPAGMQDAAVTSPPINLHPHFAAFGRLMHALAQLQPMRPQLRMHAAAAIARRLSELKAQVGVFGFADLLARLDNALDPSCNGENAGRLRQRILTQYPVALIDEFQDTSPVQTRIFDRLYRIADNDPKTALLLIGDPKQAIYAFRGADIYSYLRVRRATEGRHYVLGTNYRSTDGLVNAVNHLFQQAEARSSEGAFMFRAGRHEAMDNPLPFNQVAAHGRVESLVTSEGLGPAVTFELDDELCNAKTHQAQFAARCAERIVTLLNDEKAGFARPPQAFERLRPADIAVLVKDRYEAADVKRELRRRDVASVYLSDANSVFESDEARDLVPWLSAVASPRDAGLARAAFATRSVGLSVEEMMALAADDEAFDQRIGQLQRLHDVWQRQGVLTMLRLTLHLLDLPARWLGSSTNAQASVSSAPAEGDDGERRLTNFLHLAELLQTASATLDGEQALIRWLRSQVEEHGVGDDEQIVRLESDADLVKLVTIHKSKGLEYPLVFLPFPYNFWAADKKDRSPVILPDEAGRRTLIVEPTDDELAATDRERRREDLRLLYVALTRARHLLWVGLAALKKRNSPCLWHESAIGYILGGPEPVEPDALAARVSALIAPCPYIVLLPATRADQIGWTRLRSRSEPRELREPAAYVAEFDRNWSIGSFSGLVRALASSGTALWASSPAVVRDDELLPALVQPAEGGESTQSTGGGRRGP